ncbi:MAG: hypothetical protein V7L21_35940 [Nostoc sp.]|uniref:hypothetical protein n=1 Tax=Nostoc sp. TaxID=1180 RepID=UPI002FFCA6E6
MNNDIRCLQTEDIEINCSPSFQKKIHSNFWKCLHHIWENFVKKLLADPNELQVWQKVDRHACARLPKKKVVAESIGL